MAMLPHYPNTHHLITNFMSKKLFAVAALATLGLVACTGSKGDQPQPVVITGSVPADANLDGTLVYLYKATADGRETLDSVEIKGGKFAFDTIATPDPLAIAELRIGRKYRTPLVLEGGNVFADMEAVAAVGTPLNDSLSAFLTEGDSLMQDFYTRIEAASQDSTANVDSIGLAMYNQFLADNAKRLEAYVAKHKDNILGLRALSQLLDEGETTPDNVARWKSLVAPALLESPGIQQTLKRVDNLVATAPGMAFRDFAGVDDEGKPNKLSDFVGKGNYVLADFWASWCGPCRRAIPELMEINKEYGPKGLKIVGIAVWDKMDDHLAAMKELKITWPQIFSEKEATDLYGVRGVPQIMLFGPDGKIVARDLHGLKAIKEALEAELAKTGGKL